MDKSLRNNLIVFAVWSVFCIGLGFGLALISSCELPLTGPC